MFTKIAPPRPALAVAAALLLLLAAASPARASETTKILEACSNGTLPTGYSQQAYSQAIKQMPPELSEYTDCPDLIHKAQLAGAAGSHGGGGGAGSGGGSAVAAPTPTERRTLENIPHASSPPVQVDGEVIHPGVVHVDIASALSALPTPLLALLAFLLACALLLLGRAARNRVRRGGGHFIPRD
ncbi:MAG: hypothetical protein ACRDLF_07050 [Solirubrobacteraceae bacterium]